MWKIDDDTVSDWARHAKRAAGRNIASHLQEARREILTLLEEIDDWKCASMLEGSSGDPADIEPRHVEAHITDLRRTNAKQAEEIERLGGVIEQMGLAAIEANTRLEARNAELVEALREAIDATSDTCEKVYCVLEGHDFVVSLEKARTALAQEGT